MKFLNIREFGVEIRGKKNLNCQKFPSKLNRNTYPKQTLHSLNFIDYDKRFHEYIISFILNSQCRLLVQKSE
jgi:hypothetical protein